jgi:hypothetical protein
LKSTRNRIVLIVLLLLAAALIWFGRGRIHFSWRIFVEQLRLADWRRIALALACIYLGYVLRSARWVWLIRHQKRMPLWSLLGTQVMGFTAVALIGRVADLVRPYLVSKKTGLPLSSQMAVYVVERLFDAGSMALIASSVILLSPPGALPHPEVVRKAGYWGLALTVLGGLFLVAVRLAGSAVAAFVGRTLGALSPRLGHAVRDKIETFHSGLDTIRTAAEFATVGSLSVGMWLLIALAYMETMRSFAASPQLAAITPAKSVLMMIFSGAISTIQLPVLGWFTQIAGVAAGISGFFGVASEPAMGCAATLLLVTFLGIVPVGLVWARFERVSLFRVAAESGHAGEELAQRRPPSTQQV